ncbi:MAG: 2'-hydroxybiphenyl-2-sulfinate desulfinase [Paracidovorax wautersii]|uniref:2'-hydroxybiphenyl-2-sulfinate desulfinase n=1 Tax=Paracidovorax wautersii TaxID=1177982 RepID=A0A7V8JPY3_9BURK|nr:MAG: 2'-hydroxybiphenyl-2-sulfinate desulfinase [Paracidovorax wautersii]
MSHSTPSPALLHVSNCGTPAASAVASRLGLLEQAARDYGAAVVDIRDPALPGELRKRHWDHALDTLVREGGNIPPLWTRAQGAPTRLIGLTWVDEYQAILVRREDGPQELRGLAGGRLGVPRNGQVPVDFYAGLALRGFANGLALAGLSLDDARLVDVPITPVAQGTDSHGREVDALLGGQVDAVFVHGIEGVLAARQAGVAALVSLGDHPDPLVRSNAMAPRAITVHQALLDAHPGLIERYLAALIEASRWADAHPDEALAHFGVSGRHPLALLRQAYGQGPTRHYRPTLEAFAVDALRHHARFLETHGFIRPGLDIDAWIDPGPLQRATRRAAHARDTSSATA